MNNQDNPVTLDVLEPFQALPAYDKLHTIADVDTAYAAAEKLVKTRDAAINQYLIGAMGWLTADSKAYQILTELRDAMRGGGR